MGYFNTNRSSQKKCPAAGCNKLISLTEMKVSIAKIVKVKWVFIICIILQLDKELEKKIKAHLRRERRKEAELDSDADDADVIIE